MLIIYEYDHTMRQIWTDVSRVLFRLADGRTRDAEVLGNWDVLPSPETALVIMTNLSDSD